MLVAGVDGCRAGWVAFNVALPSRQTTVEIVDLPTLLKTRPPDLACIGIDIPIGLLDGSRACDRAARTLLGWPRRNSVFSPPCRAALAVADYGGACSINRRIIGSKLTKQAWCIAPKVKQVDDAITPECQRWAYEVHPEVCFWALAGQRPMTHKKKSSAGVTERLELLRSVFPTIDHHLQNRPSGVSKDDLLDAAVAAWTALKLHNGEARSVCDPQRDSKGLTAGIWN
jgi:predicted RNase H-like nuclease